jgi:predicted secreted protein
MPHFVQPNVHADRGRSFMRRGTSKAGALLYAGSWDTNDVYVYDYPSGTTVGTITGNDEPYGMCVDQKGDVYVANFGNGTIHEYAHGGTIAINTYFPGGELIGCSVSARGEVAATSFDPGQVTVYAKGKTTSGTTYSNSACEYIWTMGYSAAGDLVGVGEYTSIDVCALMAGSKSETTLSESGITIGFPGGTMWDGKYVALGDQEAGGTYQIGVWPATISGTTITAATPEVIFHDSCESDYAGDVNPFFAGKTNVTPKTKRRATNMVGPNRPNVDCSLQGVVNVWKYPAGGAPIKTLQLNGIEPYGVAVSIAPVKLL